MKWVQKIELPGDKMVGVNRLKRLTEKFNVKFLNSNDYRSRRYDTGTLNVNYLALMTCSLCSKPISVLPWYTLYDKKDRVFHE